MLGTQSDGSVLPAAGLLLPELLSPPQEHPETPGEAVPPAPRALTRAQLVSLPALAVCWSVPEPFLEQAKPRVWQQHSAGRKTATAVLGMLLGWSWAAC